VLADRCHDVFKEFLFQEVKDQNEKLDEKQLLSAFKAGTVAAKTGMDMGNCPFSTSKDSSAFLAWLAGFRCCSRKSSS
jgi:hypothetical protein